MYCPLAQLKYDTFSGSAVYGRNGEARLRAVLYRSLFELHRLENENNNSFTTFELQVNTHNGNVKVVNLDAYGALGSPYHAPEVFSIFLHRKSFGKVPGFATCKSRSWAYGLKLCNLLGAPPPWSLDEKRGEERNMLMKILEVAIEHKTESLVNSFFSAELFKSISPGLTDLVRECLWVDPLRRASVRELLNHPYFCKVRISHVLGKKWKKVPTLDFLDSLDDNVHNNNKQYNDNNKKALEHHTKTSSSTIHGNTNGNYNANKNEKHQNSNTIPNILKLPSRLFKANTNVNAYNNAKNNSNTVKKISDLKRIKPKHENSILATLQQAENISPIHDVEIYKTQFLPKLSYSMIKYSVPIPLRRLCWLMILGIDERLAECTYSTYRRKADYERSNKAHSKRIKNLTRQLNKDLPRCHRYNQIMKLPEMQSLIQRIVASWILGNKHRVYWQGLDSVCAAFAVALRSEAISFSCMDVFLSRLLPGIFVDDNSTTLQERLLRLQQLVSFLDPELSAHFFNVGVTPNLYAIPWLMTLFAHILPLDLLFNIWDALLGLHQHNHCVVENGGSEMLVVLFAACFLSELRDTLLNSNFEQAVAFLTRLPTPLSPIVHATLARLPTAFLLIPCSVLRGTTDIANVDNPSDSNDGDNVYTAAYGDASISEKIKKHHGKKRPLKQIRFEIAPRICPNELFRDPVLEHSLLVDVRSASRFREIHILGSRNFSLVGRDNEMEQACRCILKSRLELKKKYVAVIGERIADAADMASALVTAKVPSVLIVDGPFDLLVQNALAGELIVQSSK